MHILLIEDDLDDVELLEDALKTSDVAYKLQLIKDGSAAVNYCKIVDKNPDIIILDFNLPKVHGRDVVAALKSNPILKKVPLLILTTSSAQEDINYAYQNGAAKYLIKPTNITQIKNTVRTIIELAGSK